MATISERIEIQEKELVALKDQLVERTNELSDTPDSAEVLAMVDDLSGQVEAKQKNLDALIKAERALAERAKAAEPVAPAINSRSYKSEKREGGDIMWKMATAKFIGFAEKKPVAQVIEERYKGASDLRAVNELEMTRKTAVAPADTTTVGWAAELVQSDVQGFLNTLRTTSVAAAVAARSTQLSFGGYNSITVPHRNPLASTLTEPAWVGEGGVIPLTQFSFGSQTINRYKLAAITTMTREIAERSTPAIEGLLRDALSEAYGEVLDAAFLSASGAVAGIRPAGILNGVTQSTGTAGGGEAAVIGDIKAMVGAMTGNRMGAKPVLLINSTDRLSLGLMLNPLGERSFAADLASSRLLGIDVISSHNVPVGTAILVDASALATAFDAPTFDVSDVATVTEANADGTAPTQANTGAADAKGTAGQVPPDLGQHVTESVTRVAGAGYTARSLWQTYSLGIRMIAPTSWAVMRPNAVESVKTLTW